jgi:hypothetical protein
MPLEPGKQLTINVPAGNNWVVFLDHEGGGTWYPATGSFTVAENEEAVITLSGDPPVATFSK